MLEEKCAKVGKKNHLKPFLYTALMSGFLLTATGCGWKNPSVPAGHEGYRINKPFFIGKHKFIGTMKGPISTGVTWRDFIEPTIDMRPITYSESFQILSKDNLNVSFQSHAIIRLKEGSCKDIVEKYGGDFWFERYVREPYRTMVRESVRPNKTYEIKDLSPQIAEQILHKMKEKYKDTPIIVESMSIGNIDYPRSVNSAVEQKLAKQQELEKKKFEIEIAKKDAEIRIVESKGIAKAQKNIDATLTPNYLQHEALKVQEKLAQSPNTTIIYIPVGRSGIPVVHNSEAEKVSFQQRSR